MKCDQAGVSEVHRAHQGPGTHCSQLCIVSQACSKLSLPSASSPASHSVLKKTGPEGKVLRGSHQESPISASEDSSARGKKPK